MPQSQLGDYIRKLRQDQGLTLQEAAQRMSMNYTYLSKIENGRIIPEPGTLAQIANGLNGSLPHMMHLAESLPEDVLRALAEQLRAYYDNQEPEPVALARSALTTQLGLSPVRRDLLVMGNLPKGYPEALGEFFGLAAKDMETLAPLLVNIARLEPAARDGLIQAMSDFVKWAVTQKGNKSQENTR